MASQSCCQQNSSTVQLVDHTYDGHWQTMVLDDVDNVGRVYHEQERAHYGYLQHAELDDVRCRLPAAVTHILPMYEQNHDRMALFRPKEVRRCWSTMVSSTMSNDADRSSRARAAMSPVSGANRMSDMSPATAASGDSSSHQRCLGWVSWEADICTLTRTQLVRHLLIETRWLGSTEMGLAHSNIPWEVMSELGQKCTACSAEPRQHRPVWPTWNSRGRSR